MLSLTLQHLLQMSYVIFPGKPSNIHDQVENNFEQLSLNRKPNALPPLTSSFDEERPKSTPRPRNLTTPICGRQRSPRVKMQDSAQPRKIPIGTSHTHNGDLQRLDNNGDLQRLGSSSKSQMKQSKNIHRNPFDREIESNEQYIQSLLKQNKEAAKSRHNDFDTLCANLVNEREQNKISRGDNQRRSKTRYNGQLQLTRHNSETWTRSHGNITPQSNNRRISVPVGDMTPNDDGTVVLGGRQRFSSNGRQGAFTLLEEDPTSITFSESDDSDFEEEETVKSFNTITERPKSAKNSRRCSRPKSSYVRRRQTSYDEDI